MWLLQRMDNIHCTGGALPPDVKGSREVLSSCRVSFNSARVAGHENTISSHPITHISKK